MKKIITILSCVLLGHSCLHAQYTPVEVTGSYNALVRHAVAFNGKFVFGAGNQLWSSDGTTSGTVQLKAFNGQFAYGPYCFKELNNKLYFMANDSLYGEELWVTDGSSAGTSLVKDINSNNTSSLQPVNNRSMYPHLIQVLNGKLYFAANDGINGKELWMSDGTDAGTQMVKDIYPGGNDGISTYPGFSTEDFLLVNGKIYFPGNDGGGAGLELWMTDGTAAGTQLVNDIVPGTTNSEPRNFIPFMDKIIFTTTIFSPSPVNNVYISDGTAAGTIQLASEFINTMDHVVLNNKLYFGMVENNSIAYLYETDGTVANTNSIIALNMEAGVVPGDVGKGIMCLTAFNNKLYFRNGQNGNGMELWQSDGTTAGTAMLKDMCPGDFSTHPNTFTEFDNKLFFRTDDSSQMNINYTDGTLAGTAQVQVPSANYRLGSPFAKRAFSGYLLVPVGNALFYVNPYDTAAVQVYKLDISASGVSNQPALSSINIYPNPSQGFVTVDAADAKSISVYSIDGKMVYQCATITADKHNVDTRNFAAGTYSITTLLSDGTKRYGNFVKQ